MPIVVLAQELGIDITRELMALRVLGIIDAAVDSEKLKSRIWNMVAVIRRGRPAGPG